MRKFAKSMVYNTIIHLHIKQDVTNTDYYYGSIAAIYEQWNRDVMGINYDSLCNALRKNDVYENKNVIVRCGKLVRKKQKH